MFVRTLLLIVTVVFMTLSMGTAVGQERNVEWFITFRFYDGVSPNVLFVMRILAVPEVEAELQLSAAQQAKIAEWYPKAVRKSLKIHASVQKKAEVSEEEFRQSVKKYNDAREAFQEKYRPLVWDLLTEAQRHRLQQIIWQIEIGFVLLHDKNVREHVVLTDEQERAIRDVKQRIQEDLHKSRASGKSSRERRAEIKAKRDQRIRDVLTEEQLAAWLKLTGEPFDLRAVRTYSPEDAR